MFENGSVRNEFCSVFFFLVRTPKAELTGGVVVEGPSNSGWHVRNCTLYYKNGWKDVPSKWHRVSLDFTSAGSG